MSRLRLKLAIGVAVVGVAATTAAAIAGDRAKLRTSLSGFEEVPVVSTSGGGEFRAAIDRGSRTIQYRLTYGDMEGTVQQSHIHLGQELANGGIAVFLCTNLGNGPAGTQTCPQSGTISGTIDPADVLGPTGQGIPAGAFDELAQAIRAGLTYVNVHSSMAPNGEIRGQIANRQND